MDGFYFLLLALLVIFVSFLSVRAAAIALMMAGMSEKRVRFQALSASSGTGFTTKEAESVVDHPVQPWRASISVKAMDSYEQLLQKTHHWLVAPLQNLNEPSGAKIGFSFQKQSRQSRMHSLAVYGPLEVQKALFRVA